MFRPLRLIFFSTIAVGALIANSVNAHFPWLIVNSDGKAMYFFGENIADRTYHLPPSIANAELMIRENGKLTSLATTSVDTENFVGLLSKASVSDRADACSQVTFGIYHGSRLEYYTQFLGRKLPKSFSDCQPLDADLQAHAVDTDTGVDVYVLWKGKPLADAKVKLFCEDGHEEGTGETGVDGKVSFSDEQVEEGLNGIMVGHTLADAAGKLDSQAYDGTSHYLTATFFDPEAPTVTKAEKMSKAKSASEAADASTSSQAGSKKTAFAALPFGITSFGAARLGNAIFVYGGHTGDAHSYSDQGQSKQLLKLDLEHPNEPWQVIAEGERIQGLGMAAHDSRLFFIGGFEARNKEGQEHNLHSLATVRAYDVKSQQWCDLPPLPEGRSSHDAALVGDTLFVVGGWLMQGDRDTKWHTTALAMDLNAAQPVWTEIAPPSFRRRALALAAHDNKLFVLGGMNAEGGPTRAVEIYDPQTKSWATGPELLGESGMDGFGAAAWSVHGQLTVTNIRGDIQVLSQDGRNWESLGSTRDARFFHRLMPLSDSTLLSIGGASMESGKFLEPELVPIR